MYRHRGFGITQTQRRNRVCELRSRRKGRHEEGVCGIVFLHYNNGEKEKLIKDILSIQIIDENTPAIITLKSGGELRIQLDRIEIIVDDSVLERRKDE